MKSAYRYYDSFNFQLKYLYTPHVGELQDTLKNQTFMNQMLNMSDKSFDRIIIYIAFTVSDLSHSLQQY